ncbi:MAG: HAD family hydrolase [Lachnospiraceae bacterium]|nr:HAD family hydrolase [Lachnospiraceae bacterium]
MNAWKNERYVLWDLDGTLTESAPGIINSVLYALEKMGIYEKDRAKLEAFVGPPLLESFQRFYGMTPEEAKTGMEYYREYFVEKGMLENQVYPGIPEVLDRLNQRGYHLAVATSKPEIYSRRILDHFGLTDRFVYVGGSTLDETRCEKADVITYVMETLGISPKEHPILMVGDRLHDVQGAAVNRIPCLGVLYGYGSREELETAGAVEICGTVAELPEKVERCFEGLR